MNGGAINAILMAPQKRDQKLPKSAQLICDNLHDQTSNAFQASQSSFCCKLRVEDNTGRLRQPLIHCIAADSIRDHVDSRE